MTKKDITVLKTVEFDGATYVIAVDRFGNYLSGVKRDELKFLFAGDYEDVAERIGEIMMENLTDYWFNQGLEMDSSEVRYDA